MTVKLKFSERVSIESLYDNQSDPRGTLFINPQGQFNMEKVKILHVGIDTIRQLYTGLLIPEILQQIEGAYTAGFNQILHLAGQEWLVGSGGQSGYQYRLQNSDLGLICFIKSRYATTDREYSHLKIEASPHWIIERDTDEIHRELKALASTFFQSPEASGISVHLCVDFQGFDMPKDFSEHLVTRAKRNRTSNGMDVTFARDLSEVSIVHSLGQSYLFGSSSSLQCALYRKDIQARNVDKFTFWECQWLNAVDDNLDRVYIPGAPVWRLEFRFHHSILQEFGRGVSSQMEYGFSMVKFADFKEVADHLTGLWRYALHNYRFELEHPKYAEVIYWHPLWQLFYQDVTFLKPAKDLLYKRIKKTPGDGNERNVAAALGNMLSIYARNRFTVDQAMKYIKESGIYNDLCNYFHRRYMPESAIREFIEKGMQTRILLGRAA